MIDLNFNKVGFFTPIDFNNQPKSWSESLLETTEGLLPNMGCKKACVIPGEIIGNSKGTELKDDSSSYLRIAAKVIVCMTVILPFILLTIKAVLRTVHKYHIISPKIQEQEPSNSQLQSTPKIDAKAELEKGIEITSEMTSKISLLFHHIFMWKDHKEIIWHKKGQTAIFSLTSNPAIVFKTTKYNLKKPGEADSGGISERYANMVNAKKVIIENDLDLLVIPQSKKFEMDCYYYHENHEVHFIAEEYQNILPGDSKNENLYRELSGLKKVISQLAVFIIKTGFSDVAWRNIPILDRDAGFQGDRRIALIDLEEISDPAVGIFGGNLRYGLISCLFSEELIDRVIAIAKKHGVEPKSKEQMQAKAERIKQIDVRAETEKYQKERDARDKANWERRLREEPDFAELVEIMGGKAPAGLTA